MTIPAISLRIDGDYIDSFVYSGALFILDRNFVLRTYPWKEVVASVINSHRVNDYQRSLISLLLDSRTGINPKSDNESHDDLYELTINPNQLLELEQASLELDTWPTDINIFANRLFFSSESGVDSYQFSWENGSISKFYSHLKIWDESAFQVSPNTMNRLAIAAGNSGVISAAPHGTRLKSGDIVQIINTPCGDCDWQGATLIANTQTGPIRAEFEALPKSKKGFSSDGEYWAVINSLKRTAPNIIEKIQPSNAMAISSWIGGDRLFAVDANFQLHVLEMNSENSHIPSNRSFHKIDQVSVIEGDARDYIVTGRTAAFGTLLELSSSLLAVSESGTSIVSESPVRWRVFPRAKNYANHLHIVEEQCLRLTAFKLQTRKDSMHDRFGFSLDAIDSLLSDDSNS